MCDGRDNTKKMYGFTSILVSQKNFFFMGGGVKTDMNQQKHKKIRAEILIRNHVNMMTTVTKTSNTAVMEY